MRTLLATLLCAAALPAVAADGAALFAQHCAACHQPGGVGLPGLAPPLAGTLGERLKIAGRGYLPRVVMHGMTGPITVQGARYTGAMPPFGTQLPDEALAAVLNHVLEGFNAGTLPEGHQAYTPAELAEARETRLAPHAVRKLRDGPPRAGSGS
ncbi:cytochrome c [Zoogloea sp.]|uniref:c-type cytochrome n=1 Tax=Zoogloea sp. TaxID=49181 RepID=UPI00262D42F6|nr:cytochrome c [Zoogloea sp.]MDD3352670.1 cytochrome c [Zoogloea sp.]